MRNARTLFVSTALVLVGVSLVTASCDDSNDMFSGSGSAGGGSGYTVDASAEGGSAEGGGACAKADYAFSRSCADDVDAGSDAGAIADGGADGGGGVPRSNTKPCTTSFDCAGVCCACPPHGAGSDAGDAGNASDDAGGDDASAAPGPGASFRAYACVCGVCSTDPSMCARMLAGDPTLCP